MMINLIGADWEHTGSILWQDEPRSGFATRVNEMGEYRRLVHGPRKAPIRGHPDLSRRTWGVRPADELKRLEAPAWILFENQKLNGFLGPYRFLRHLAKTAPPTRGARFSRLASTTYRHFRQAAVDQTFVPRRAPDHSRFHRRYLYYRRKNSDRHRCQYANIAAWAATG